MKECIMECRYCNEDTRHLTTRRFGNMGKRIGYRLRREVKHCTQCNKRTITNGKENKTYIKNYG